MQKTFCIVNPYSEEDLNLLKEFEKNNNLNSKVIPFLLAIKDAKTEEEYEKEQKLQNDIWQSIYIKKGDLIDDYCFIEGQKDIKKCTISFSPLRGKLKKRTLLTLVTDYALNILNMEEVFITLEESDNSLVKSLEENNFENIGNIDGKVTYLKEKTDY